MSTHTIHNLNAVSQTLLVPLCFRAMESQRPDALVRDPKAVELVGQLDCDFSGVQRLKNEQVNYLLCMRECDRLARALLAEHPDGVIVDLGCGLDTRFERVDNRQLDWYGLDLPEVIELRKELLDETPRSHFIGCSVLDFSWMDALSGQADKPILFLAEAMLVYLEEADVKRLVQALAERFPGAELVCDAYSPVVIRFHPRPPAVAQPRWGLRDDRDVESWAPGIRLLSQWYYFDEPEPRLGVFQLIWSCASELIISSTGARRRSYFPVSDPLWSSTRSQTIKRKTLELLARPTCHGELAWSGDTGYSPAGSRRIL